MLYTKANKERKQSCKNTIVTINKKKNGIKYYCVITALYNTQQFQQHSEL